MSLSGRAERRAGPTRPRRRIRRQSRRCAAEPRKGGSMVLSLRRAGKRSRAEQPPRNVRTRIGKCRRTMWTQSGNTAAQQTSQFLAQAALGRMRERGRGVPEDHEKAVRWYRRAAEQGTGTPRTTSASCTSAAGACARTTRKPSGGTASKPSRRMNERRTTLTVFVDDARHLLPWARDGCSGAPTPGKPTLQTADRRV